jgi:hypothetical protein
MERRPMILFYILVLVIEATISVKKFWQSISVKFPLLSSVALALFSLTSLFISRI